MDTGTQTKLLTAYGNAFKSPWSGSIYQWAEDNIILPSDYAMPGAFTVDQSPYLKPIFDWILDPEVEQINIVGARQIFKSGTIYLSIAYWLQNEPGPILLMMQTDPVAETFVKRRILPILQNCKSFKETKIKYTAKTGDIALPHVSVKVSGHKESILHGLSVRYLLCDELRVWETMDPKDNSYEKALHATNQFIGSRKIIITTTPGIKGDKVSKEIDKGQIYRWYWTCPKCNQPQPWHWNHQKGETKGPGYGITWIKHKDVDGKYDYNKTGDSAYLECKFCQHQIKETTGAENERTRIELNKKGKYVLEKEGNKKIKTAIIPAWVNPKISFKSKIVDYITAKYLAKYGGNKDSLIDFYNHVLGEEFNPQSTWAKPKIRIDQYDSNADWPAEVFRCMAVDYQAKGERYFVIRAFDIEANSRLNKYGKVFSWDQINQIAEENKVPRSNVFVDAGYDQPGVLLQCSKYGKWVEHTNESGEILEEFESWLSLKGDKEKLYLHEDALRRYYDKGQEINISDELPPAVMYLWAANSVRNILGKLRDGQSNVSWASNKLDQDYINQLFAEVKETDSAGETKWTRQHKDNHYFDCECMAIVAALMAGLPLGGSEDIKII